MRRKIIQKVDLLCFGSFQELNFVFHRILLLLFYNVLLVLHRFQLVLHHFFCPLSHVPHSFRGNVDLTKNGSFRIGNSRWKPEWLVLKLAIQSGLVLFYGGSFGLDKPLFGGSEPLSEIGLLVSFLLVSLTFLFLVAVCFYLYLSVQYVAVLILCQISSRYCSASSENVRLLKFCRGQAYMDMMPYSLFTNIINSDW